VIARFKFLSGARTGDVETFGKAYIGLGRHPLSDVRFDAERDLDVSARHAAITRKPDGYYLQDLGSRNGTFVNGTRITRDVRLADGDVIGFGASGPTLEFRVAPAEEAGLAKPAESPPSPFGRGGTTGRMERSSARSSTAVRIAIEVARQTRALRRTTKVLLGAMVLIAATFAVLQWQGARSRGRELRELRARADSLGRASDRLVSRFEGELRALREALAHAQSETARLRSALASAGGGDPSTLARLRADLEAAELRQRGLIGAAAVDYRSISRSNQDAVAIVLVEFSDTERYSGTAFAIDSQGTLITNKHVLVGEDGTRTPRRLGVMFAGSRQNFPARIVAVSPHDDVGVLRVTVRGGVPRVAGLVTERGGVERGDPVAILGYPLGFDLPMERSGDVPVAEPTLTVGMVSKVLPEVIQLDGYGAPGSSGSPILNRDGRVVGVLYGGERESAGKIIYAVPSYRVVEFLGTLGIR
jgi:S1-C subfamily serine protease